MKMQVHFPDTLAVEERWQTAFYEADLFCHSGEIWAVEEGLQGIWWLDKTGAPWFLMRDGSSTRRPSPHPVVKQRVRRDALPTQHSAGHL